VLLEYRTQGKYKVHEFVLMPDHFHLLITVGREITIERALQLIKGGFAYRAGKELGFRAPVWQKGFSEVRIYDAVAYERTRHYIHNNPVARFLSDVAENYPHCSAHPGFDLDQPPLQFRTNRGVQERHPPDTVCFGA
jgi:REP-associated tyrosine transposase